MMEKRKAEAIAASRSEIAKRIARFCTSLSPEDFDALLDRMAKVQWKYQHQIMPMNASEPADAARQLRKLLD